jgi:uncharacterized repeat protein (TIGR02543 family)
MRNRLIKRGFALIIALFTLVSCFAGTAKAQEWDVKRGDTDYYVELNESTNVFICNKGRISSKVGTEYYMTYTVESIEAETFSANGIMGTNQPGVRYPYLDSEDGKKGGLLYYHDTNYMLIEGNTYFVKFTITEDGYKYRLGWAKDDEAEYIKLRSTAGKVKTDSEYFGIWLGNKKMNGKLTRVRIYDKHGNDLGVQVSPGKHVSVGREETFAKDTKIDHRYTVELKDAYNVAISNKRIATGDKIYMQYKVASSNSKVYQWGAILSDAPKDTYPYLKGQLQYTAVEFNPDIADNGPLLVEGAEYLLIFEKKGDYFDAIVQRTIGGKTTFVGLDTTYGTYDKEAGYFSLWFGGSKELLVNAVLEDFKCYDSNKNNLGIQCNKGGVTITHYGELEDYAGCEAMYYAKEDDSFYALYEDQSLKYTANGSTEKGNYKVRENVLTTNVNGTDNVYDYKYLFFTDEGGKEYQRLQSYKVSFDTKGGSPIETQILNADNGYQVMRPSEPTMKNNTFEGWYTSSGEEFNFDKIVTESVVVYAKWAESDYVEVTADIDYMPYIYLGASVLILALAVGACIFMTRRRKTYGTKGEA